MTGWELQFIPDSHGIEGLARQIKTGTKAFPLFELARLVLEKPERFRVEFKRAADTASSLFQLKIDGSVWLSEQEAIAHLLAHHLDAFYRRERVPVEPPKGVYTSVAQCGLSGVVLGPSNYHDYQSKIRKLHAERFAHMPFEAYKNRIRIVKDEALIQQWKDELSSKDEFYPLEIPERSEPVKLGTLAEVEAHFRQNHMGAQVEAIRSRVALPGAMAVNRSAPPVQLLVRRSLDELRRFPLPMVHLISRQLESKGLKIFKAHQNVTYVAPASPRYLDREATPVSEAVWGMLEYLETHVSTPRAGQWKALLELRPLAPEMSESARETAVMADFIWLLREGHVMDYAARGLEVARKPAQPKANPKSSPAAVDGAGAQTSEPPKAKRSRRRRRRGRGQGRGETPAVPEIAEAEIAE